MQIHKTFPANDFDSRESRLVFVDQDSGGENSESSEFNFQPNVEDWKDKSFEEYDAHLTKAVNRGEFEAGKVPALLSVARQKFNEWESESRDAQSPKKILALVERARHNREDKKIAKRAVDAVKEEYLSDANDIRDFVRGEIEDFLKIPIDKVPTAALEDVLNLQDEILTSIQGLLKTNEEYAFINNAIERDKERAKESYKNLRDLFQDQKKKDFLEMFLKLKNIPAGQEMSIRKILNYEEEMRDRWSQTDTLVGVVKHKELLQLEQALKAIESIYKKWNSIEKVEEENKLQKRLFEYENRLSNFHKDISENPPKALELAWLAETWPDIHNCRMADVGGLKKLLAKNKNKLTLKLVQAFLEGSIEELEYLEKEIAKVLTAEQKEAAKDKTEDPKTEPPDVSTTSAPTLGVSDHAGHGDSEENHEGHGPNTLNKIGKGFSKFFTAQGRIKWYSFHDIEQAFHLIKESWKKHTESHSEDKSGKLADKMMFWRAEIRRRVHETDLIAEKGRADERKKRYKNDSYEELISEIIEWPAKDKRRAILETLAERGNLRMSDHRLINAITHNAVSEAEWNYADSECDYIKIVNKFKKAIDKDFIGETGYGQQLMDMQTSGQANKESLGEKLGDHSITGSPGAECAMVAEAIESAGLDGDNVLTGLLKKGFDRGNKYADNGAMCKITIQTEHGKKEINENASAGLDALKIVDGYLKGLISNQTVQGISKKNEGMYTPYAAFQDVLIPKNKRDPNNPSRAISAFELWGWIRDGAITDLGRRQIVNFFDSRVAFDDQGNIRHIARDSTTYARHSKKYTSITTLQGKVGDKMRTTCIKAGGVEIYDNATQRAQGTNQIVGQQQEVTFLIKAALEEIEDGITMQRYGQDEKVIKEGKFRLEKGTKALEIMFGNIVKNTEDREIFLTDEGNVAYKTMERIKDINNKETYGELTKDSSGKSNDLKGFLDYYLIKLTGANKNFSSHYNRVMRAYANLEDESKILPRDVRDAKNKVEEAALQRSFREAD
ncbi:MAG: hypothetical protein K9L85_01715 [Candidatus Peribacteraceae bacterium]|nr:hypothetical protein [Candidatus Peribacteraceae bacterium]